MAPRIREAAEARLLSVAHELRTPLTALSMAAWLLDAGEHGPLTDAQRELTHTIAREAARLTLALGRVLETDRLGAHAGPVERTQLDLGDVVRRALLPLRAQAEDKCVALDERYAEGDGQVLGDATKLGWVAASLVGNALRFTPSGSSVRVRVSRRAGNAELVVRDRGPGIEPDRRRDVLSRDKGGTLFLVQEIVEAHGGRLRLSGTVGKGTTVTVALPRVVDPKGGVDGPP